MGKVIKLGVTPPAKLGLRKARRRKVNLEDFGQLNLFQQEEAKVFSLPGKKSFFDQAMELDEKGDPNAEKYYLLAVNENESVEDALCNLAILKSSQGDNLSAIDYLTQCLKKSPRHFEAHYNLGNVYSDMGNFDLAKVHYEVSAQIAPEFPNSFYNLGLVLISLKQYKEAIESINTYIELSPDADMGSAHELISTLNAIAQ